MTHAGSVTGKVEQAVRSSLVPGQILHTPTQRGTFSIAEYTSNHLVLLLGAEEARTRIPWTALEGVPNLLRRHVIMKIGGIYDTYAQPDTLDGYLKAYIRRATGGWVAVVLEEAGVIDIDRTPPARIRLSSTWTVGNNQG